MLLPYFARTLYPINKLITNGSFTIVASLVSIDLGKIQRKVSVVNTVVEGDGISEEFEEEMISKFVDIVVRLYDENNNNISDSGYGLRVVIKSNEIISDFINWYDRNNEGNWKVKIDISITEESGGNFKIKYKIPNTRSFDINIYLLSNTMKSLNRAQSLRLFELIDKCPYRIAVNRKVILTTSNDCIIFNKTSWITSQ